MSLALCNLRCGAKERVQITDTLAWWFGSLVWLGSNSGHIVLMEIHCLTEVFAHEVDMLKYF